MVTLSMPGHLDLIKQINVGMVYRLIDGSGPISRIELSKKSQLAPASITKIVRELLEAHIIKEVALDETACRGRPAIGLLTDDSSWHYLAVQMTTHHLHFALCDFSQDCIAQNSYPLPEHHDCALLDEIIHAMDQFFITHQSKLQRLTAIAFTLSGIVDTVGGIIHHLPFYSIEKMPLKERLEKHTGLPVFIQNDIAAWTLAEALFGASQGEQDVIQVMMTDHVGIGVITAGKQLYGSNHSSLEMGHIRVTDRTDACYCGNHGCLETVAGTAGMLAMVRKAIANGTPTMLQEHDLSIDTLCRAVEQGDALACNVVEQVSECVGDVISVMVNLFNPKIILIGSPLNRIQCVFYPALRNAIEKRSLPLFHQQLHLLPTCFTAHDLMIPAALVKQALYKGTLLISLLQG